MHKFEWDGEAYNESQDHILTEQTTVTIHHNSDYSGNVVINIPTRVGQPSTRNYTKDDEDYHIAELHVPFEAIEALVIEKMRFDLLS